MKAITVILFFACLIAFSSSTQLMAQTKTPRATKSQIKQQKRISQGVKSGELTKSETVRLEAQQAKIHHDKVKAKSDGVVTKKERAKFRVEQKHASRTIYRKKHNERTK